MLPPSGLHIILGKCSGRGEDMVETPIYKTDVHGIIRGYRKQKMAVVQMYLHK